jgi:hypothetical protein
MNPCRKAVVNETTKPCGNSYVTKVHYLTKINQLVQFCFTMFSQVGIGETQVGIGMNPNFNLCQPIPRQGRVMDRPSRG